MRRSTCLAISLRSGVESASASAPSRPASTCGVARPQCRSWSRARAAAGRSRAEEGVGRDERAGADAGDDLEPRAIAALRPADQQAGAERAVIGAARQGEILDERPAALAPAGRHALARRHVRLHEGDDVLGHLVAPEAGVGETRWWPQSTSVAGTGCADDARGAAAQRNGDATHDQRETAAVRAQHEPPERRRRFPPTRALLSARAAALRQPSRRALTGWLHRCFPVVEGAC